MAAPQKSLKTLDIIFVLVLGIATAVCEISSKFIPLHILGPLMYMANVGAFSMSCQKADQQWKRFIEMYLLLDMGAKTNGHFLCILDDFRALKWYFGVTFSLWTSGLFLMFWNQGSMENGRSLPANWKSNILYWYPPNMSSFQVK